MSDSLEPPAKRARLEADAPFYGTASLDAPGSPVDDMDDDFYDTTPVKPAAQPVVDGEAPALAAAASAPASFHLPGLAAVGEATAAQPTPHTDAAGRAEGDASEEGEQSDADAFYLDERAVEPAAANQAQAPGAAPPQHGKLPHHHDPAAVSLTPAQDAPAVESAAPEAHGRETVTEPPAAPDAPSAEDSDGDDLARLITDGLAQEDSKAAFLQAAEANKDNKEAEWQLDSDASESGSSSDSSSSGGSSDEEGSDDGELLDPEEQVRQLMAEAVDEPGTGGKAKVKTMNEEEEKYEKPDITVTPETKITELGKVESVVENIVVVKAKVSGDLQVLESGSALCLQDRTVIGKISEQMGRVEDPRYSVGFNSIGEITALGIAKDTPVYYVDEHSTFVFTEPLRAQKHTDASNLHDEETQDVEFSDDEKEAEYKREQKAKKRARQDDDAEQQQPPMKIPTGPKGHVDVPSYYQPMEYQGGGLKYSDDEDEDLGMYKPLARPDHFEQIVGQGAPIEDRSHIRRGMMRGGRGGPWGDRGRGFRGRGGFGGRGDFGGGQGGGGAFGGGGSNFGGGKGDRGGHGGQNNQGGNKGGAQGGRTDRTCYACGQVGHQKRECPTLKPQLADRGRAQEQHNQQQDPRQRNGQQQDHRSATSASPSRQQDRGQSQPQHSPPAKSKNKNRKQRMREKKEKEREQQKQQQQQQQQRQQSHASPPPPAASNTISYANNSNAGWPQQYSHSPQPAAAYAPPPPPPPPAAAASYANPAVYAQPGAQPAAAQGQNPQANWAAWAQWIQVVGAMQQQQAQAAPAPAPPPPPPPQVQAQVPVQYPYAYQQYAQQAAPPAPPPANPQQQSNAQSAQSLQDILRALGGGQR